MPDKCFKVRINLSNLPDELFVKAEDQKRAIFAAYMAMENFFAGDAAEISAEEYAAADNDLKDEGY